MNEVRDANWPLAQHSSTDGYPTGCVGHKTGARAAPVDEPPQGGSATSERFFADARDGSESIEVPSQHRGHCCRTPLPVSVVAEVAATGTVGRYEDDRR